LSDIALEQLQASEARLVKALGDPTKAVFYDDFKRENRPISEIQGALAAIRAEISRLTTGGTGSTLVVRRARMSVDL
jgi:hypothetical protein